MAQTLDPVNTAKVKNAKSRHWPGIVAPTDESLACAVQLGTKEYIRQRIQEMPFGERSSRRPKDGQSSFGGTE